ncbi:MAG TPA: hypothetical protein VN873_11920 [Candidatus Angelobacter sp.]|nr:hypothetical protein [Candidatus Angelobacter sp.]
MKRLNTIYIGAIAMAVAAGTVVGYARDRQSRNNGDGQNSRRSQRQNGDGNQTNGAAGRGQEQGRRNSDLFGGDNPAPGNHRAGRNADNNGPRQGGTDRSQSDRESRRDSSKDSLTRHNTANGYEETSASGRVRTRAEKESDGEHVSKFDVTGRKQSEEVDRTDGSKQVSRFDATGRVRQEEVDHKDGSRDVSNHEFGRDGKVRATETVKYDVHERIVNKTVTKTVNKVVIVNHYDRGRFGFVYHPVFVMRPFVRWYDPYWYTPAGVVIVHPFHYHWGWDSYGWYHAYYGPYWTTYDVYPTPSYWVTDWMVASYLQDHYEAQMSVDQARAEAQAAREEADKAAAAAQTAQDQAEISEAKAAQAQAELQARNAEAKLAAAEHEQEEAGKPNPNATPIDKDTKEALKNQIDQTIAEKKALAEQAQSGKDPVLPDVSKAFADPKHIYPVSKVISVTSAKDSSPAGNLSEGDLLKVEPGQDDKLKNAGENDLITMRVMTSKGDDGEVPAGSLVNVSVHDLQDFDSEFRAKLDAGLNAADQNQDAFKQGATTGT